MKLTPAEKESLRDCLKDQIQCQSDLLDDHDSFSHGDWLRFEQHLKNLKSILKKMGRKK